jgi:hypothetical protein
MRQFAAVLAVLSATVSARAETLPSFSMREATYHADTVVLAEPIDVAKGRFKVTQVLRGHGAKAGATIELSGDDCALYTLHVFAKSDGKFTGEEPAPVAEAMLFLEAPAEGNKPVSLVMSGLRLGTVNDEVYTARQVHNPGPYIMTLSEEQQWPRVVRDTKATVAAIDEVLRLREAHGKDRTAGLLRWVERHRFEFGGGFYEGERTGWGSLEGDVFEWACERAGSEDCWAAVRMYAELNRGATLLPKYPCFGTNAGRTFLLQIALNERLLDGDRARAVTLLSQARTLTPKAEPDNPAVLPCSDDDVALMVRKLTLLLPANSATVREAATRALHMIRVLRGAAEPVQMELKNALPALEGVYKEEKPGPHRDLLVEIIHTVGGAEHWKEVSGNSTGVAAVLRDFGHSPDQGYFWLQVLPGKEKLYERPTLVLERLDQRQKVIETKTVPLPVVNPVKWEDGWTAGDMLLVQFARPEPRPDGQPTGGWRVSVRGTLGKDKVQWASEPKLLPAPNGQQPRRYDKDVERW